MSNGTTFRAKGNLRFPDIAAIVVFILGLVGWLYALPLIESVLEEWMIYPDPGDAAIGITFAGAIGFAVSFILLLAAIVLCQWAKRLHLWFQVMTVTSPALGCVAGLAFLYRAFSG